MEDQTTNPVTEAGTQPSLEEPDMLNFGNTGTESGGEEYFPQESRRNQGGSMFSNWRKRSSDLRERLPDLKKWIPAKKGPLIAIAALVAFTAFVMWLALGTSRSSGDTSGKASTGNMAADNTPAPNVEPEFTPAPPVAQPPTDTPSFARPQPAAPAAEPATNDKLVLDVSGCDLQRDLRFNRDAQGNLVSVSFMNCVKKPARN